MTDSIIDEAVVAFKAAENEDLAAMLDNLEHSHQNELYPGERHQLKIAIAVRKHEQQKAAERERLDNEIPF